MNRRDFLLAGGAFSALAGSADAYPFWPGVWGGVTYLPTGDALVGGTNFGFNSLYQTQGKWPTGQTATAGLATQAGFGGSNGVQLYLTIPTNSALNLPAYVSGSTAQDQWYFLRVKMPLWGTQSSSAVDLLLGKSGFSLTSTIGGGGLAYKTLTYPIGSVSTGWQVDVANAGNVYLQRANSGAWQLFNQGTIGFLSGVFFEPGVTYGICVGIHYNGANDVGRFVAAVLGDSAQAQLQTATGSSSSGTTRPAAQIFDLIGTSGSPANNGTQPNFSGEVSDLCIVNGPFPTVTQIQNLTDGAVTLASVVATQGGVVAYRNSLDFSTVSATIAGVINALVDPSGVGGVTASQYNGTLAQTTCGPHSQNGVLTLTPKTPWWVWATAFGATDGQVWFDGTTTAPAATHQVRVAYQDGTFSAWTNFVPGASSYQLSIRIPISKNFRRQIRIANQNATLIAEQDLQAVGYVIPCIGQSEVAIQAAFSATFPGGTTITLGTLVAGYQQTASSAGASVSAPFSSFCDQMNVAGNGLSATHALGWKWSVALITGASFPGDGMVWLANAVMGLGVSVMMVNLVHPGAPKDIYVDCNNQYVLPTTTGTPSVSLPSISGAGSVASPFVFALPVTTPLLQNWFNQRGVPGNSGVVVNGGFNPQIKVGTLIVTMSDGSTVTDTNAGLYPFAQGGLAGTGVDSSSIVNYVTNLAATTTGSIGPASTAMTVASGTGIAAGQYVSGVGVTAGTTVVSGSGTSWVVSVSQTVAGGTTLYFSSNAPSTLDGANVSLAYTAGTGLTIFKVSWQAHQEIIDGSTAQKTTQINGYGTWEGFNDGMNFVGVYGFSGAFGNWYSAEAGEAPGVTGQSADQTCKWTALRAMMIGYARAGVDAGLTSWKLLLASPARQTSSSANVIGTSDVARATVQSIWSDSPWVGARVAFMWRAGFFYDDDTYTSSPHQNNINNFGTERIGETQANALLSLITATPLPNPLWASVSNPGGTNVITITASGLGGGSLTVDTVNGGSAAALDSWYIGTSSAAGTLVDNASFATAAISGSTVTITKASGNWTGSEIVRYVVAFPGLNQTAAPRALVYLTGGSAPSLTYSPGLLMPPLWYPAAGPPDNINP